MSHLVNRSIKLLSSMRVLWNSDSRSWCPVLNSAPIHSILIVVCSKLWWRASFCSCNILDGINRQTVHLACLQENTNCKIQNAFMSYEMPRRDNFLFECVINPIVSLPPRRSWKAMFRTKGKAISTLAGSMQKRIQ